MEEGGWIWIIIGLLAIAAAIIAVWFILFVIVAGTTYIVCGIYVALGFIATNVFVALDKVFYLGFNVPPAVVWLFWGIVIGAAIQGSREMGIYGRQGMRVLIALAPVLLLAIVNLVKTLVA